MSFILSKNATHEDLLEIINPSMGEYLKEKGISDAFIDVFITSHKDTLSSAFAQSGLNYRVQKGGIATMYNNTRHRYNTYHLKTSNINHVQPAIHGDAISGDGDAISGHGIPEESNDDTNTSSNTISTE